MIFSRRSNLPSIKETAHRVNQLALPHGGERYRSTPAAAQSYPDAFSWVSAIRSSSQNGRFKDALCLYTRMQGSPFVPTTFAISAALKACARIPAKVSGTAIHAQVHKFGHERDVYVQTALVDLYSKLGDMGIARKVFDEMPARNVVSWNSILFGFWRAGDLLAARRVFDEIPVKDAISWNSMIAGYAKAGDMPQAESFFRQMPHKNVASWNGMISGYILKGNVAAARKMFDEMPERSNVSWIEMISAYAKCGAVHSSRELFDQREDKDLGSWNAMIACYAQNSWPKEAILLFGEMLETGDLKYGLEVESYMSRIGIELDDHLRTALVDLHAKCGSMDKAYKLFNSLSRRDLVSYSAMIMGCGINGRVSDAIHLFDKMVNEKMSPNAITFTGLLTAYNHAGMVDEGYQCFSSMMNVYRVPPSADHYAIVVDLLGRTGRLEEAMSLITSMTVKPHTGVWGALLLSCKIHGNVELGEIAAKHCIELETESESSGYIILLANIYASVGRWDDAKRLRREVEEKSLAKTPGCSWLGLG
ncbi:hypothetical protein H6P81_016725 [Aristolochia fimbriata]|uniref:Pentatricopeptide repeat-containing protein n=1 Tax=Aristolochia fimbriata TaxID=158543 RepID=A0AAV7E947_ARIFI|nr:hypothetical protein H6P81_016725 [Aristolochia fimbriata]